MPAVSGSDPGCGRRLTASRNPETVGGGENILGDCEFQENVPVILECPEDQQQFYHF